MKKRILSLVLVLALLLSFSACGGKGGVSEKVTVTFPKISAERYAAEKVGAFAVDQYVNARMKTEELIEYDLENGSASELSAMIEETLQAWRVAEAAANGAEQIASAPESLTASTMAATMVYSPAGKKVDPFVMVAYAAKEDAATKWAREITEKFDSYPANARIKSLAQDLGVDAKNAYTQLQMAQDILKGNAEREEGDLNALVENTLIATRTVCKTTLYVTGTVASAGTATAFEAGCMVIGGVDTVVDIATTGSTIIRGENDSVTLALSEVKDYLAPVSAVAGGISLFSSGVGSLEKFSDKMGLLDKFTYVGDSLLDYFQENKVLGVQISEKDDAASMSITEFDAKGKRADSVVKKLEKAGFNFADTTEAKPASEIVSDIETEMGGVWTTDDVEEYYDNLLIAIKEQAESEKDMNDDAGAGENTDANDGSVESSDPSISDSQSGSVVIYDMTTENEDGLTDRFPAEVLLHEDGTMEITFTPHGVSVNDDFTFSVNFDVLAPTQHLVGRYDSATNTFTGMGDTGDSDDVWNWATTVLRFDPATGTASGIMGGELEGLAAASFTTKITMVKRA